MLPGVPLMKDCVCVSEMFVHVCTTSKSQQSITHSVYKGCITQGYNKALLSHAHGGNITFCFDIFKSLNCCLIYFFLFFCFVLSYWCKKCNEIEFVKM